ncbi:MAG TPA: hypothetical protein ENK44_11290 [Caldithrix abyssi]|uniref:Cobalt ECF transporter T component CbiQ n=1 Tax=Caldithrix abyssi TaxID=187145 RepID=A0A7V4WWB0_CALAY|nr:hypothetical protein [Caldithrix abyssi]
MKYFLQTLDVRAKFIFIIALIILIIQAPASAGILYAIVFAVEAALIFFSGNGIRIYFRRTVQIYPMFLLFTLPLLFRSPADASDLLFHWQFIRVYFSAVSGFISAQLRLLLIYLALLIFTTTTPIGQFFDALQRLRLPAWFSAIIRLMLHFLKLIRIEFNRMYSAFRSRYSGHKKSVLFKAAINISVTYMLRLIMRSERSYMAMMSRGFNGSFPARQTSQWTRTDTAVSIVGITLLLGIFL